MNPRGTLCKIGARNRIEALRNEGCVFMNTLDTFWAIEDGGVRGDRLDGVHEMRRGPYAEISKPDGTRIPVDVSSWTLETRPAEPEKINLFCMYALRWDEGVVNVDARVSEFGECALVMTDPNEFQRRLYQALEKTKREFHADLVAYVPDDHVGDVGLFRKIASYAFQSEWRVACTGGDGAPLLLKLGSLADIATIIPSTELGTCVTIGP